MEKEDPMYKKMGNKKDPINKKMEKEDLIKIKMGKKNLIEKEKKNKNLKRNMTQMVSRKSLKR